MPERYSFFCCSDREGDFRWQDFQSERGDSRMKTRSTLSVPLKEQENLKELFYILEENGLEKEKRQLVELADCIDSMDQQLGKVLEELKTVREQLDQIQEKGIRQSAVKVVGKVESKAQEAKTQLAIIKARFMDGVNRTLTGFKKRGVLVLSATMDFLGIRQGLLGIKKHLQQTRENAGRGIDQLASVGDEIHGVKTHLGNIKRELAGKEPLKAGARDVEKGAVFQVQKMLYGTMGMLDGMEKQTDRTIRRLDSLGEEAGKIRSPQSKRACGRYRGIRQIVGKHLSIRRKQSGKKRGM